MLFDCLDKCEVADAFVKVVLSDQGPNFQSLVNKLGISTNEPYFFTMALSFFTCMTFLILLKAFVTIYTNTLFNFVKTK